MESWTFQCGDPCPFVQIAEGSQKLTERNRIASATHYPCSLYTNDLL